jgi:hypothetical protein
MESTCLTHDMTAAPELWKITRERRSAGADEA